MEGKLIKLGEDKYDLLVDFDPKVIEGYELSLTNCQAIERGYDLDELANERSQLLSLNSMFKAGFQKALEILGDKKFTEDELKWLNEAVKEKCYNDQNMNASVVNKLKSLQQTEWDVEIVMEPCFYDDSLGGFSTSYTEGKPTERPKLDNEGCLILKRKK